MHDDTEGAPFALCVLFGGMSVSNNLRILHRANEFMAAQQATESHPGL